MNMSLRFVLDENLRGPLWRTILRQNRSGGYQLDVVRVGDLPDLPLGSTDDEILQWCEKEARILVSFDKATLAGHLAHHLKAGRHSPGIFMLHRSSRLSQVAAYLALIAQASEPWEWQNRIEFIPN